MTIVFNPIDVNIEPIFRDLNDQKVHPLIARYHGISRNQVGDGSGGSAMQAFNLTGALGMWGGHIVFDVRVALVSSYDSTPAYAYAKIIPGERSSDNLSYEIIVMMHPFGMSGSYQLMPDFRMRNNMLIQAPAVSLWAENLDTKHYEFVVAGNIYDERYIES